MTLYDYPPYKVVTNGPTRVEVNDVEMRVFTTVRGPLGQVTPGYTQINVGKDKPAMGITVPTSWWEQPAFTSIIKTSGNRIKKLYL